MRIQCVLLIAGIGVCLSYGSRASDPHGMAVVPAYMVTSALECASRVSGLPMVDTPVEARVSWQSAFGQPDSSGLRRTLGEFYAAVRDSDGTVTRPAVARLAAWWQSSNQNVLAHELTHFLQHEHGIDPLSDEAEAAADRVGYACRLPP